MEDLVFLFNFLDHLPELVHVLIHGRQTSLQLFVLFFLGGNDPQIVFFLLYQPIDLTRILINNFLDVQTATFTGYGFLLTFLRLNFLLVLFEGLQLIV